MTGMRPVTTPSESSASSIPLAEITRARVEVEFSPPSAAVLDLLVDRYIAALGKLEAVVENVEQQFLLRGFRESDIRRLYRQRRDLLRIHTVIAPMAEICRRLARVEMRHIDADSRAYFGEVADRVLRDVDAADYFSNGAALGMRVNDVVIVVKTSATIGATLHVVTAVTAGGAATVAAAILA
mgnify:CR=1 FL=1